MRVLVLHNHYRRPGGEDIVAQSEIDLLRSRGVEVLPIQTRQIDGNGGIGDLVRIARSTAWSADSYEYVRRMCEGFRPDVAHVHNFWMKLSPSVHKACHDSGVPTVQTLHNFRLLCTNALLLRNGKVCEDCVGRVPWRGVVRRCYRNSLLASGAVAQMVVANRRRGTWHADVDAFIALSQHSRRKFVTGAVPADRIFVKPNFVPDPGVPAAPPSRSNIVVYAGRLSEEKGVDTLLAAWSAGDLGRFGRLVLAGDGPARDSLISLMNRLGRTASGVTFLGDKTHDEVMALMAGARAAVQPSICYETFGVTVAEAFACGRPVIVSNIAALNEIVSHGHTGLYAEPSDHAGLATALAAILRDDRLADELGENARTEYLDAYTPDANYEMLMKVYAFAMARRRRAETESEPSKPTRGGPNTQVTVPALQGHSASDPGS